MVSGDRSGEVVRASGGGDGDCVSATCWAAPTGVRDDVEDVTSAFVIFACIDDIWRSRRHRRVNIAVKLSASKTTGFGTSPNFVSISALGSVRWTNPKEGGRV